MIDATRTPADLEEKVSVLAARVDELERSEAEHRRANDALRGTLAVLETILSESPDPAFSLLPDGRYAYVNRAFAEGVRMPVGEIICHTLWDVFPRNEADSRFALFSEVVRSGKEKVIEVRVPRDDGDRYYLTTLSPIKGPDGAVISVVGSSKEITDRKRAEDAREESRERYRSLSEASFEAIFLSENGICIDQNGRAEEMFGYTLAEAVGRPCTEWIVAPDRDRVMTNMLSGYEDAYEVTALRKDGSTFPAQLRGNTMSVKGKNVRVSSLTDITERKRAEEVLRDSEDRLRRLIEHSPISIAIVGMDGQIEYINRRAVETFGYAHEDIPDMDHWWRLAYPDETYRAEAYERWMGLLGRAMASGQEIERREYRVTRKDGSEIPTVIFGVLVAGKVFAMFEDIAALRQAEEERLELERRLLHSQKLESLGILAGGVAHDFNNLLTAILGNLDLALFSVPEGSAARAGIGRAMAAGRRAAGLATRMLAYSGRGAFVLEPLDLNVLIEENAAIFMASAAKTATLSLQLHRGLPSTIADASQLQQIVMNLITNASEALGDRAGNIVLSTGVQVCDARYLRRSSLDAKPEPGRFVWLEVSDTGCGMNGETVQKIFDPFFTTKFAGRGLGMSAVLGIVRGHHGAIVVDSVPSAGTTIRVLFPVAAAGDGATVTPAAEPPAPAPVAAPRGVVLVVDDEDLVRSTCCSLVEALGFQWVSASDGVEAIDVFKANQAAIRVVLLDLTMPRLDGLETFRELHRIRPEVPVILCSGFSEQELAERCAGEGIAGFIQKPYGLKVLGQAMTGALKVPG